MRYLSLIFLLIFSCSSQKDILLLQDSSNSKNYKVQFEEIKIKSDDILRVKVSSQSPELANLFSYNENIGSNNLESNQISGYQVNRDGYINIPLLKAVNVKGLTLTEASIKIQKSLKEEGLLINSSVDVKIVNSYFTIIGEVNQPGRYNFLKNDIDIFQAIGLAGDLTINGKRDNIKVLRKNDDNLVVNTIDLTSSDLLISKNYQIFPGDIIIINPNNARVKNAGIIGNSGNLLSVLSFILSSIILITAN